MTSEQPSADKPGVPGAKSAGTNRAKNPDWTQGLRQLYDSVVEEDLPDSFKDLLSQLDDKG